MGSRSPRRYGDSQDRWGRTLELGRSRPAAPPSQAGPPWSPPISLLSRRALSLSGHLILRRGALPRGTEDPKVQAVHMNSGASCLSGGHLSSSSALRLKTRKCETHRFYGESQKRSRIFVLLLMIGRPSRDPCALRPHSRAYCISEAPRPQSCGTSVC